MNSNEIKHLISWKDWQDKEIKKILDLAVEVKANPDAYGSSLDRETLVLLFQKTSTRTRVSFEAGMTELGGHAIFLDWMATNFNLTKIEYESAYLSRSSSAMMARMKQHEELLQLTSGATVPVINGCCNRYHPCQAMADMLTIYLDRGSLKGAKLTYLGVHNNVVNSMMALCATFGVELTLVCPIATEESIDEDIKNRIIEKGLLTETLDKKSAVNQADYIYTDTWVDMEFFNDPAYKEEKEKRIQTMLPYQINAELIQNSSAKIMHDMPIHTGYEITEEMVEHPRSIIFDQAENRLYAQKAILLTLIGTRSE